MSRLSSPKMYQSRNEQRRGAAWARTTQFNSTSSNGNVHEQGHDWQRRCQIDATRDGTSFASNATSSTNAALHPGFVSTKSVRRRTNGICYTDDITISTRRFTIGRTIRMDLRNSRTIAAEEHEMAQRTVCSCQIGHGWPIDTARELMVRSVYSELGKILASHESTALCLQIGRWGQKL